MEGKLASYVNAFFCHVAVCVVYFGGVWDYAEGGAEDDDSVWGVLFCVVCGGCDCGQLGDVGDQALI
jgi:hypothetical protein